MKRLVTAFSVLTLTGLGTTAIADSHVDPAIAGAMKARQAHMQLYAHNIGLLGNMARDQIDYDAEAASAAASNIAALSQLDQSRYWPEGSDNSVDGSKALPALWDNLDDVMSKSEDLVMAAAAMEEAAGQGLGALKGAMGGLGEACGACHEDYRESDD
ncbi:MAG: cytochrome c [Salibaculum sp.]|uniref:c-type cytochrome n=1 Tax=Roseovarius halophilus (ex Wu et al. 2025) TaxID=3376060 RepID=UPI00286FD102|nr:cytochrome c [Salibaculum sp.]MDR9427378.1 cytochrome c [Salibaculum sp.]MDR9482458.1 cytochrome c [Salibaculum sp.]